MRALWLTLGLLLGAGPAAARPAGGEFALRWSVAGIEQSGGETLSHVRFSLRNGSGEALPAAGWALYFTTLATARPQQTPQLSVEAVAGTLYRLRPGPAFAGLPAGASVELDFIQPGAVTRPDKAPQGPYLAYDDAPAQAQRLGTYRIDASLPGAPAAEDGPEALYARNAAPATDGPPPGRVLPTPLIEREGHGELVLTAPPRIEAPAALAPERTRLHGLFAALARPAGAGPQATLRLALGPVPGQKSPEAYRLRITPAGIAITGVGAEGVARGVESLRQLLPATPAAALALPALEIVDAPRFAYRGLMLDVARNFRSPAEVCRVVELMAQFKLNRLHLHLTDDEGWRLAIPGLPELTTYGAVRGHAADESEHLLPAHGSGPDPRDPRGSGFYGADDFTAILRCAAERRIEVLPEIEMPGHARAAVKAMEARARRLQAAARPAEADRYRLRDPGDRSRYRSAQGHDDNVIDPGLPSTYRFIQRVLVELKHLYARAGLTLRRVHLGGDELGDGAWEQSPAALALMRRQHLAGTADAWDAFYGRVARDAAALGLQLAGWEELGARKTGLEGRDRLVPNPRFTGRGFELFVWNNLDGSEDLAYRLANAGYGVVLAPATRQYFDMAPSHDPREPGVDWAAYVDLHDVWSFAPLDATRRSATDPRPRAGLDVLSDAGRRRVLGLEGTLFSEAMREPAQTDHLLMPRLLGLAERAWAADPAWARVRDPAEARRLHDADWWRWRRLVGERLLPWVDATWPDLAYRMPPPGLHREGGRVLVNHLFPGTTVRYTLDGSAPRADSPVLDGAVTTDRPVTAAAFTRNGRASLAFTLP